MTAIALLAMASGDASDAAPRFSRPDDDALLERLRQGDERALEILFVRFADPLAAFARRIGVEASDAEQVVVDVFHDVWQRRATVTPDVRLDAYLFRAVRNRALDRIRADSRRGRYETAAGAQLHEDEPASLAVDGESGEASDAIETVRSIIATLPESQRTALYLRYTRELPLAEVASAMDLSLGAVKMLLQRAVKTLRERIGGVFERL